MYLTRIYNIKHGIYYLADISLSEEQHETIDLLPKIISKHNRIYIHSRMCICNKIKGHINLPHKNNFKGVIFRALTL